MRVATAFFSSLHYTTKVMSYVFSFGHDELHARDSDWLIPLYVTGQLAKYVLGFPIGIIIATFAAGMVGLTNFFKSFFRAKHPTPEETPILQHAAVTEAQRIPVAAPANEPTPMSNIVVEPVTTDPSAEREPDFHQRALFEKREKLTHCMMILTGCITQKIAALEVVLQPYEESLRRIDRLQSDRRYQKSIAETAMKVSHQISEATITYACRCGFNRISSICPRCRSPLMTHREMKNKDVRIPDIQKRSEAQRQYDLLTQQIEQERGKYIQPPDEYMIRNSLDSNWRKLQSLLYSARSEYDNERLTALLIQYKSIVSSIEPYFSVDDHFDKDVLLPKSSYAQRYVSIKMMEQLSRQHGLFQQLPAELKEQIILASAPSLAFPL